MILDCHISSQGSLSYKNHGVLCIFNVSKPFREVQSSELSCKIIRNSGLTFFFSLCLYIRCVAPIFGKAIEIGRKSASSSVPYYITSKKYYIACLASDIQCFAVRTLMLK